MSETTLTACKRASDVVRGAVVPGCAPGVSGSGRHHQDRRVMTSRDPAQPRAGSKWTGN